MVAWAVSAITILLAIMAWGQSLQWQIADISTYLLFPILGLIAFSLLWAQYATIAMKKYTGSDGAELKSYFSATGWLVLFAILLHPGLLIWQLWRDGAGIPPGSELSYVLPGLKAFVILGMTNLTILILFEFRRVFAKKRWWKYFGYLVDLVMLSIFVHGLKLGTQLQSGWYRFVWLFYGFTLILILIYIHVPRKTRATVS